MNIPDIYFDGSRVAFGHASRYLSRYLVTIGGTANVPLTYGCFRILLLMALIPQTGERMVGAELLYGDVPALRNYIWRLRSALGDYKCFIECDNFGNYGIADGISVGYNRENLKELNDIQINNLLGEE